MEAQELLRKMNSVWEMYEKNEIEEPKLKENRNIIEFSKNKEYLDENDISAEKCSHLSKAHWPNLQQISLCKII